MLLETRFDTCLWESLVNSLIFSSGTLTCVASCCPVSLSCSPLPWPLAAACPSACVWGSPLFRGGYGGHTGKRLVLSGKVCGLFLLIRADECGSRTAARLNLINEGMLLVLLKSSFVSGRGACIFINNTGVWDILHLGIATSFGIVDQSLFLLTRELQWVALVLIVFSSLLIHGSWHF